MIQIKTFTNAGLLNDFLQDQKVIYKDLIVKYIPDDSRPYLKYILVYEKLR